MAIIKYNDISVLRHRHKDEKIVLCTGTFDLTHVGHVLFFEDCKKNGDILVVGIGDDNVIKKYKGKEGRPIFNENIRLKMVDSLKPVDYCFLDPLSSDGQYDPLKKEILEKLRPDAYVINNDAPSFLYEKKIVESFGIEFVALERWCPSEFEQISTTKIIKKIKDSL